MTSASTMVFGLPGGSALPTKEAQKKDIDDVETDSQSSCSSLGVHLENQAQISEHEEQSTSKPAAFVLVDPWSTGNTLWREMSANGFKIIVVWENNLIRSTRPSDEVVLHTSDIGQTISHIQDLQKFYDIKGVLAGSETGVPLSEALGNHLHLPSHPLSHAAARRNKYLMGETLREAGVRAVQQKITTSLDEAIDFIENDLKPEPFEVIVKPNMGAGSDDVYLCRNMDDFKSKFNLVNGKINSLGLRNDGVLVQEFLNGIEYVIDSMSRNGKHRICSIWQYDKREANGRFNVYHGSFPLVNDNEISASLISYVKEVLNALEFQNGPSHAEIKMTKTGPCLVEVGARCHGGAGAWMELAQTVWGANQLQIVIDAFKPEISEEEFFVDFPKVLKTHGCVLDLILYEDGYIEGISDDWIRAVPSFHEIVYYNKIGDKVIKTVDCNTQPGHMVLFNDDGDQVKKDFEYIHSKLKEKDSLFHLRPLTQPVL